MSLYVGMSDHAKTMLQETGRVNVQGMTVAAIVEGLNDLGIDLSEARVFNITGVTLRVTDSNQESERDK